MAIAASPEPRCDHESALIGDELYLFGGTSVKRNFLPRDEIWSCNIRVGRKWIRHFAKGKDIPPPCEGAQCVVINGIIYSYGGRKKDRTDLGEVFGLDPEKMKWIQVATPTHGKKPWERYQACLWAIGGRLIMFGGGSWDFPEDRLQSGACYDWWVNNEIFEFVFEGGKEKGSLHKISEKFFSVDDGLGHWMDVDLSGTRPAGRRNSGTETIDQYRGLLHGGYDRNRFFNEAFVIDLKEQVRFSNV